MKAKQEKGGVKKLDLFEVKKNYWMALGQVRAELERELKKAYESFLPTYKKKREAGMLPGAWTMFDFYGYEVFPATLAFFLGEFHFHRPRTDPRLFFRSDDSQRTEIILNEEEFLSKFLGVKLPPRPKELKNL